MFWALLIAAIAAAAVYRAEAFWELLAGIALLATVAAVVQLEPLMILTGLGLLVACAFRWRHV